MSRPTRSFKLKLSPAGMDLLIDSHCHLIRTTRRLLAWGTTLHVAVDHLETMPAAVIGDRLGAIRKAGLAGAEEHHVGAPHRLAATAAAIAERVRAEAPGTAPPPLGHIYLLALQELAAADKSVLLAFYERSRPMEIETNDRNISGLSAEARSNWPRFRLTAGGMHT